jgi:hypothetical protein
MMAGTLSRKKENANRENYLDRFPFGPTVLAFRCLFRRVVAVYFIDSKYAREDSNLWPSDS